MSKTRHELESMLNRLAERIADLRSQNPDLSDFLSAFAGEADIIQDAAGPADDDWVHERLTALLGS